MSTECIETSSIEHPHEDLRGRKRCSRCKLIKANRSFARRPQSKTKLRSQCRECEREQKTSYRQSEEVKEHRRLKAREYRRSEAYLRYYEKIKTERSGEGKRRKAKRLAARRRREDPLYNLKKGIIRNVGQSFKKRGFAPRRSTEQYLGYSMADFISYLKDILHSRYSHLSIEDYGLWGFDHICPISQAQTLEETEALNHYSNFQPLTTADNRRKSHHRTPEGEALCQKLLGRPWIETLTKNEGT